MKVGVIGLGDIAHKAYLPVLTTQPGVRPVLHARSPAALHAAAETYRIPPCDRHDDIGALLASGLDAAFVHAPDLARPGLVERIRQLLDGGRASLVGGEVLPAHAADDEADAPLREDV